MSSKIIGLEEDTCPAEVRVFHNMPHMGFAEAEDSPATQELMLGPKECNISGDEHVVPLKFVRFQNVMQLAIFVSSNHGDADVTKIRALEVFGNAGESSNIADWKPCKS